MIFKNKPTFYNGLFRYSFLLILIIGLFLRFYQYLMGRSLWEDECHLALNLMDRGFVGLTKPLDFIQAAPIFFLFAVKSVLTVFGFSETAFRFIPFFASVAALPLCYYVLLSLGHSRVTALFGFFLFSVNLALLYFSSELKPYTVDVTAYLVMVYLYLTKNVWVRKRHNFLLALAGCVFILFSNVAFIVLFCLAFDMIVRWVKNKNIEKTRVFILISWAVVFTSNYFLFIHNHPATQAQRVNYAFAFCPTDVLSCEFVTFLEKTINETFFDLVLYVDASYGFKYILLALIILSVSQLVRKKMYTALILTVLPVLFHLGLSAMGFYPFWYRLILYLVPCFIFILAYGVYAVVDFVKTKLHVSVGIIIIMYAGYFMAHKSIRSFPLWFREIKPALDFVNKDYSHSHVYITDPVNAYTYYYRRGYAKAPLYRALSWELDTATFNEIRSEEKNNFVLFYQENSTQGYRKVIDYIKANNLAEKTFSYKSYEVSVIKPLTVDTGLFFKVIDNSYFDPATHFSNEKLVAIWSGEIKSMKFNLPKGKFVLSVASRGTPADKIFPQLSLALNEKALGNFYTTEQFASNKFEFELENPVEVIVSIKLTNDLVSGNEDRNAFVRSIKIIKTGE